MSNVLAWCVVSLLVASIIAIIMGVTIIINIITGGLSWEGFSLPRVFKRKKNPKYETAEKEKRLWKTQYDLSDHFNGRIKSLEKIVRHEVFCSDCRCFYFVPPGESRMCMHEKNLEKLVNSSREKLVPKVMADKINANNDCRWFVERG